MFSKLFKIMMLLFLSVVFQQSALAAGKVQFSFPFKLQCGNVDSQCSAPPKQPASIFFSSVKNTSGATVTFSYKGVSKAIEKNSSIKIPGALLSKLNKGVSKAINKGPAQGEINGWLFNWDGQSYNLVLSLNLNADVCTVKKGEVLCPVVPALVNLKKMQCTISWHGHGFQNNCGQLLTPQTILQILESIVGDS